jgi:hypothetical protein
VFFLLLKSYIKLNLKKNVLDTHPPSRGRSLSRNASGSNSPIDFNGRDLLDDYAEIVDEDGDYSVPASKPLIKFCFFCCI